MNESFLLWGVGLFALALLLFFIEVFLPSGGVVGLLVGVSAITGVVFFFRTSMMWGLSSVLFLLVISPIAFAFALKIWPNTPIGRLLILGSGDDDEDEEKPPAPTGVGALGALVGATGVAVTDLRPVGQVRIEDERVEALAEGGVIEAGRPVRITSVEGNRIKVRAVK